MTGLRAVHARATLGAVWIEPGAHLSPRRAQRAVRAFAAQAGVDDDGVLFVPWGLPPLPRPPETGRWPAGLAGGFAGHPVFWLPDTIRSRRDGETLHGWTVRLWVELVDGGWLAPEGTTAVCVLRTAGVDLDDPDVEDRAAAAVAGVPSPVTAAVPDAAAGPAPAGSPLPAVLTELTGLSRRPKGGWADTAAALADRWEAEHDDYLDQVAAWDEEAWDAAAGEIDSVLTDDAGWAPFADQFTVAAIAEAETGDRSALAEAAADTVAAIESLEDSTAFIESYVDGVYGETPDRRVHDSDRSVIDARSRRAVTVDRLLSGDAGPVQAFLAAEWSTVTARAAAVRWAADQVLAWTGTGSGIVRWSRRRFSGRPQPDWSAEP